MAISSKRVLHVKPGSGNGLGQAGGSCSPYVLIEGGNRTHHDRSSERKVQIRWLSLLLSSESVIENDRSQGNSIRILCVLPANNPALA